MPPASPPSSIARGVQRGALSLFRFCASLKLAVVLIFSAAVSLGWATFVESTYGTPAVQFGMYGTWWFGTLNALLAVNIFCAAAIRYPWKRHQTGFVITHIGLLTLLTGCLISRRSGIDAQMPIFEGAANHIASTDDHHIRLLVKRSEGRGEEVIIPFATGPFDWQDYRTSLYRPISLPADEDGVSRALRSGFAMISGFLFNLARRDTGVLYDRDGVRIEALDFYADSLEVDAPYLKLRMSTPRPTEMGADGKTQPGRESWMPVELSVRESGHGPLPSHPYGIGSRQRVGGGSIIFWMTGAKEEVAAFLHSQPQGELGPQGQVVLHAGDDDIRFRVDEKLGQGSFALGESGFQAEVAGFYAHPALKPGAARGTLEFEDRPSTDPTSEKAPADPAVEIKLTREGKEAGRLVLFADRPEISFQNYDQDVFGSYWFDHGKKSASELLQGEGGSRIDILQGPGGKLYYRYWNRTGVVAAAPLPTNGELVDAFKMPIAQLKMGVDEFVAADHPEKRTLPLKIKRDEQLKRAAVRLRVTVDGRSDEFWLAGTQPEPVRRTLTASEQRTIEGDDRTLVVTMPRDEIDVGFDVRLDDFERKLDPGTSQESHYSSVVDFVDRVTDKTLQSDVWITMNAPVDFSDPRTGRSYRLFQESFRGPFEPGDVYYDHFAKGDRRDLFVSVLTVNYDPGRGVKYAGCLFIVAGIATMFYMRAYFFKPVQHAPVRETRRRGTPQPVG